MTPTKTPRRRAPTTSIPWMWSPLNSISNIALLPPGCRLTANFDVMATARSILLMSLPFSDSSSDCQPGSPTLESYPVQSCKPHLSRSWEQPDCRITTRKARPAAVSCAACAGVILPVVIRDQERSVAVAQLQRWIGQSVSHSKGSQARPDATDHGLGNRPLLLPRMKPAITMSSPVPTKARVLILASFAGTA